jgi:hypothetical protein
LTNDVDLIASSADSLRGFTEPLSFGGRRGRASNKVEVDVIVRNDKWTDLYAAALNSAEVIEDAPIAIARPEYLLVMKMIARRDKDEQDVMFLLTEDVIDCQRCRKIVEKFLGAYAVDDFDALCEEAEWLKQKGKRR